MRQYKRPESVLIVVYTVCAQVLLLQRQYPQHFWQSVTGSMHWDEPTPLLTAQRELKEETGLNADGLSDCQRFQQFIIQPPWRCHYPPNVTMNREHVFRLCLPHPVPITLNPQEHCAFTWLSRMEAAQRTVSWTNRDAILTYVPESE